MNTALLSQPIRTVQWTFQNKSDGTTENETGKVELKIQTDTNMIGIIILIQIDIADTYRISCDKKKEKEDTTAIYVCIYTFLEGKKSVHNPPKYNYFLVLSSTTCTAVEGRLLTRWKFADVVCYANQHPGSFQMVSLLHVDLRDISFLTWIWQTHRDTYYYELIHNVSVKDTLNWKKP